MRDTQDRAIAVPAPPLVGLAPRACFASRPVGDHRLSHDFARALTASALWDYAATALKAGNFGAFDEAMAQFNRITRRRGGNPRGYAAPSDSND